MVLVHTVSVNIVKVLPAQAIPIDHNVNYYFFV